MPVTPAPTSAPPYRLIYRSEAAREPSANALATSRQQAHRDNEHQRLHNVQAG